MVHLSCPTILVLLRPFLVLGLCAYHGYAADIGLFGAADPASRWQSPVAPPLVSRPNMHNGAPGVVIHLPFGGDHERIYWDVPLALDLSPFRAFSFHVQVDDPEALSRATLYFRSGDGWYGGWFRVQGTHWQTIHLHRDAFSPEGTPDGWQDISGARISFWRSAKHDTTIRMAGFTPSNPSIAILHNTDARNYAPSEYPAANRLVDRMQDWLQDIGVQASILTDEELRAGLLPSQTRILILPYNPVMTNGVPNALHAFTASGGSLIVAYTLTPQLSSLLGLSGWQWLRAEPPDAFSQIRFKHDASFPGNTQRIRQDSWNINKPLLETATVLASWADAQGKDSGIPAITQNTNGIFIGHILTNVDRRRKQQLLLDSIAMLAPATIDEVAQARLSHAMRLFDKPDWPSTRHLIQQTARKHQNTDRVAALLTQIDDQAERLHSSLPSGSARSFATWNKEVESIENRIAQAYHVSLSAAHAPTNEFRAVWAHQADGITGKGWPEIAASLQQADMRQLFVNVLWGGAAFYPSEVVPSVAGERDYLQEALTACHDHGLALHAWFVCWNLQHAPPEFLARMRQENRLAQDKDGQARSWLCPSHPENRRLTIRAAIELATRYDIDGVHLDYIRYPDAETCFCQGCATRFRATTGAAASDWPAAVISGEEHQRYLAWRREQISTIVGTIHSSIKRVKPDIQLSAAVWPGWPAIRDSIAQDWPAWAQAGWVDFLLPMSYVASSREARAWYHKHQQILPNTVPFYPGIAPSTHNVSPAEVLRQIDALRAAGSQGFALFELDADLLTEWLPAWKAGAMQP